MGVVKPVFIIGSGRCGSSIFYKLFSNHPDVIWLSRLLNKMTGNIELYNFLFGFMENPLIGNYLRKKLDARECYPYWKTIFNGFNTPFRDLTAGDVTEKVRKDVIRALDQLRSGKKHKHIIKLTGWPRAGFLYEIFPDAKFIHVVRDGRAVSNSLLNIEFWRGYQGEYQWRWSPLNEEYRKIFEDHDRSFIALAGIQWNIMMDAVQSVKELIPENQFKEIKYEDLCENPMEMMKEMADFCELEWSDKFEKRIKDYDIRSGNFKWKEDLNESQQQILSDVVKPYLDFYNYR